MLIPKILRKIVDSYALDNISPKEINNGYCADFADCAERALSEKGFSVEIVDDEFLGGEYYTHSFIRVGDLYYDAEALDGVPKWNMLPHFVRMGSY